MQAVACLDDVQAQRYHLKCCHMCFEAYRSHLTSVALPGATQEQLTTKRYGLCRHPPAVARLDGVDADSCCTSNAVACAWRHT